MVDELGDGLDFLTHVIVGNADGGYIRNQG
jgi:hypothetical protein